MSAIRYPEVQVAGRPLEVKRLSRLEAIDHTSDILDVIVSAYSAQFEGKDKPLPSGTFAKTYRSAEVEDRFRTERVSSVYDHGGTYYGVHGIVQSDQPPLVATLKMLPEHDNFDGKEYLGEILTVPAYQGMRIGSAMLHAHVTMQTLLNTQRDGIALEAFDDNPRINDWYGKLGFILGAECEPLTVGEHVLPCHYMVSEQSTYEMVQILEATTPELMNFQVV